MKRWSSLFLTVIITFHLGLLTHDLLGKRTATSNLFSAEPLMFDTGCCLTHWLNQPKLPVHVRGWKDKRLGDCTNGLIFVGEFVLREGESVSNKDVGVRLIDVQNPECKNFLSLEDSAPKISLQFFKAQNNQVLCEPPLISGGLWTFNAIPACKNRLPFDGMVMYGINSKDNWIHIALYKDIEKSDQ